MSEKSIKNIILFLFGLVLTAGGVSFISTSAEFIPQAIAYIAILGGAVLFYIGLYRILK